MNPPRDPLHRTVRGMEHQRPQRVMVAGETVLANGRPTRLDVANAAGILAESQAKMLRDAGLLDYLGRDGDAIAPLSLGMAR
jgi:hypothetical protein